MGGKGKNRIRFGYETDKLKAIIIQDYIPDFTITTPSGRTFYLECKGYFDDAAKKKMLGVKLANPKLDIRFFFSADNPVRKGAKKRYSDWCLEHGFKYAVGNLPKEWFK